MESAGPEPALRGGLHGSACLWRLIGRRRKDKIFPITRFYAIGRMLAGSLHAGVSSGRSVSVAALPGCAVGAGFVSLQNFIRMNRHLFSRLSFFLSMLGLSVFPWGKALAQLPFSVVGYRPAPGQFIDYRQYLEPGQDAGDLTESQVCRQLNAAMEELPFSYLVSLGGFGGEITVRMAASIVNVPGADFKVYGNAFYNPAFTPDMSDTPGGSAEPGVIWVSRDDNGNGLPDDAWYEIAGSAMQDSGTRRDYAVTYYLPDSIQADIPWRDNRGGSGFVYRMETHSQPTYFPLWLSGDSLAFTGTCLAGNARWMENAAGGGQWILFSYGWGYADNHPNNSEGSNIDLDWAVDADGNPAGLESIDFVRVVCAMNQQVGGGVGETSTEFAGIEPIGQPLSLSAAASLEENPLRAWPNPCKESLQVELLPAAACGEGFIEVLDMAGRCVSRFEAKGRQELAMDRLQPGIYLLRYGSWILKIVKG